MKLDDTALIKQIEQEFEKEWTNDILFSHSRSLPSKLKQFVDIYMKNHYKEFYIKGYKNGWETRSFYPNLNRTSS